MENTYIWTDGIELALNNIKNKCLNNSEYHKKIIIILKDI